MAHPFRTKAIIAFLYLAPSILALPEVKIIPLPSACSSYPGYNSTTDIAGPWSALADSTNSSIDNLPASAASFTNDGVDRFGFITLPKQAPRNGAQQVLFRCANSTFQAQLPTAQFYPGDPSSAPTYVTLAISTLENWQSSLSFNLSPSMPVVPYAHEVNGTRLPGVYLGAQGRTGWNFKFNWGGNAGEYYLVRLRPAEVEKRGVQKRQGGFPVIDDRDWVGFLKVLG